MLTRFIYPHTLRQSLSSRLFRFFKNLPESDISLCFNSKIKLDLCNTDLAHQSIILNGFYELALSKNLIKLAQKGGLLVDIGANYGYFSCLWASLKNENKVVALEASPSNFKALSHNVLKNNLEKRISVFSLAAGRHQGVQKFATYTEQGQTGWGGLTIQPTGNLIDVEVQTLDNLMRQMNISKVDVLKIDTEGADTWVLMGAQNLLKERAIDHIYFEQNLVRMKELSIADVEAEEFLRKYGYAVKRISHNEFYAFPQ